MGRRGSGEREMEYIPVRPTFFLQVKHLLFFFFCSRCDESELSVLDSVSMVSALSAPASDDDGDEAEQAAAPSLPRPSESVFCNRREV